ncbi:MAG: hypothetical protein QM668_08085 [Agriterribacter sp.]
MSGSLQAQSTDTLKLERKYSSISDVWLNVGQAMELHIDTTVALNFSVFPKPDGVIKIDSLNKLHYFPSPQDLTPFKINLICSPTDSISFQVIVPYETKKYETFGPYNVGSYLNENNFYKIYVDSSNIASKSLSIEGKVIILENTDENPFKSSFYQEGNDYPFKVVTIYAETLIVKSYIRLPGVESISIFADKIVFDAKDNYPTIDITPLKNKLAVSAKDTKTKIGEKGRDAGKIIVNVRDISFINYSENPPISNLPRATIPRIILPKIGFIANGGDGQDAPFGRDGDPYPKLAYIDIEQGFTINIEGEACPNERGIVIRPDICNDDRAKKLVSLWYKKVTPGSYEVVRGGNRGENPTVTRKCSTVRIANIEVFRQVITSEALKNATPEPGGRPGEGGKGGEILSNIDISTYCSIKGGENGNPDQIRKSGIVDPADLELWSYSYDESNAKNNTGWSRVFFPKEVILNPIQIKSVAAKGNFSLKADINKWKHVRFARNSLQLADELFRFGYVDSALQIYDSYLNNFFSGPYSSANEQEVIEFEFLRTRTILNREKILLNLDFYGNKQNWVPKLDITLNYSLYTKTLKNSFETVSRAIYFSKLLRQNNKGIENLKQLLSNIQSSNESLLQLINNLTVKDIPELEQETRKLNYYLEVMDVKLKEVEQEIEKMAADNIKVREKKMKRQNMLKTLTAVGKMVPVYQPALGVAASAIEAFALNEDQGSLVDKMKYVAENYQDMRSYQNDISESLNKAFALSKNSSGDISPGTVKRNRKEIVQTLKPTIDKIREIMTRVNYQTMPNNAMNQEIERLKSENPEYKTLVDSITKLAELNKNVADKLIKVAGQINDLSNTMATNINAIVEIKTELVSSRPVSKNTIEIVEKIKLEALHNIDYYQYLFAKSYEYFTLKQYQGYAKTIPIMYALSDKDSNQDYKEIYKAIEAIYNEEVNNSIANMIQLVNTSDQSVATQADFTFRLKPDDLQKLNNREVVYTNFFRDFDYYSILGAASSQYDDILVKNIEIIPEYDDPNSELANSVAATSQIEMIHSGISNRYRDNRTLVFYHLADTSNAPHFWRVNYSFLTKKNTPVTIDKTYIELLCQYTGAPTGSLCQERFSAVSYDSYFRLSKQDNIPFDKKANLKDLKFTITLSMKKRLMTNSSSHIYFYSPPNSEESPLIYLKSKGIQEKFSGYHSLSIDRKEDVQIYAQPEWGTKKFSHWITNNGITITTNPYTYNETSDARLFVPVYQ